MAQITFKGNPVNTSGNLPEIGSKAPDFKLTTGDLSEKSLSDYKGKNVVLNIFPSVDTGVCAQSVRTFNEKVSAENRKSTRLNSSHVRISYAVFCLKKKKKTKNTTYIQSKIIVKTLFHQTSID